MTEPENDVTIRLAEWIARAPAISAEVRREALRSFVNWLGCTLGGAPQDAAALAYAAIRRFAGPGHATLIGRRQRLDALNAALINGIASSIDEYDDTHLRTIIHPAGPVAAAIFAIGELHGASGAALISALAIGIEVECRIGNAVSPDHYDRGWHITGTAGVFGAAAGVARLIGLNARQTAYALGLAATQSSGLREMIGSMAKSFHVGHAARCGALSALLAESGFDASERGIEGRYGFAQVMSSKRDLKEIDEGLGSRWEALLTSYKPFACGVVLHPIIDACMQIREGGGFTAATVIRRVAVKANPLVLAVCGKTAPRSGIEGKVSVYHAAAVALLRGDGSPTAYTDAAVADPATVAIRDAVEVVSDPTLGRDAADVTVTLANGELHHCRVEHAIGSNERPLSDADLNKKFHGQAVAVLGKEASDRLLALAWEAETLKTLAPLAAAATPTD